MGGYRIHNFNNLVFSLAFHTRSVFNTIAVVVGADASNSTAAGKLEIVVDDVAVAAAGQKEKIPVPESPTFCFGGLWRSGLAGSFFAAAARSLGLNGGDLAAINSTISAVVVIAIIVTAERFITVTPAAAIIVAIRIENKRRTKTRLPIVSACLKFCSG